MNRRVACGRDGLDDEGNVIRKRLREAVGHAHVDAIVQMVFARLQALCGAGASDARAGVKPRVRRREETSAGSRTVDWIIMTTSRASPGKIMPSFGDTEAAAKSGSVVFARLMLKRCWTSLEFTTNTLTSPVAGLIARIAWASGTTTVAIASVGLGVGRRVGAGVGASVLEVGRNVTVGPGVGSGVGVMRQGLVSESNAATSSASSTRFQCWTTWIAPTRLYPGRIARPR